MKTTNRCFSMALLLCGISSAGCLPARFTPSEPLSADNVDRLERVFTYRVAPELPNTLASDPVCTIGGAAVDVDDGKLYFYRNCFGPFFSPLGLYRVDLSVRYEKLVVNTNELGIHGIIDFDAARSHAWLHDRYYIDIEKEIMVEVIDTGECIETLAHPFIDRKRLLVADELLCQNDLGVWMVDMEAGSIETYYEFPDLGKELDCLGGTGDYILGRTYIHEKGPTELFVFLPGSGQLDIVTRITLEEGWTLCNAIIDVVGNRVITFESSRYGYDLAPDNARICVREIPSLEVVSTLPWDLFADHPRSVAIVPNSSMLLINPDLADDDLVIYDLNAGKELRRLSLKAFGIYDEKGVWWPFAGDWDGHYIGVYGCTWIQLFAVRPAG